MEKGFWRAHITRNTEQGFHKRGETLKKAKGEKIKYHEKLWGERKKENDRHTRQVVGTEGKQLKAGQKSTGRKGGKKKVIKVLAKGEKRSFLDGKKDSVSILIEQSLRWGKTPSGGRKTGGGLHLPKGEAHNAILNRTSAGWERGRECDIVKVWGKVDEAKGGGKKTVKEGEGGGKQK